jgi:hypothetical protein
VVDVGIGLVHIGVGRVLLVVMVVVVAVVVVHVLLRVLLLLLLWRYEHGGVLGTLELKNHVPRSSKAFYLHLNYVSNIKVLSQILYALFFLHYP